jgi:hypothetical protein
MSIKVGYVHFLNRFTYLIRNLDIGSIITVLDVSDVVGLHAKKLLTALSSEFKVLLLEGSCSKELEVLPSKIDVK